MPSFATADAALALALLIALLTGIEVAKWARLRRQGAGKQEIRVARGGIIAGLLMTAMFAVIVGVGVLIGQPLVLPDLTSWSDWLYVVLFFVPLVIERCIFVGELRSLRRMSR